MQLSARAPAAAAARRADLWAAPRAAAERGRRALSSSAAAPALAAAAAAHPTAGRRMAAPLPSPPSASSFQGPSSAADEGSSPADRDVATSALGATAVSTSAADYGSSSSSSGPSSSSSPASAAAPSSSASAAASSPLSQRAAERRAQRRAEQIGYQMSAVAASAGVTSIAIVATYYKFSREVSLLATRAGAAAQQAALDAGASADAAAAAAASAAAAAPFPWLDMTGTLALVVGGVVGMEMWARWAHRALWHDAPAGWALHKSHHAPRLGPFEANDLFAVINAAPAMGLCLFGYLTPGMPGSLAFGAGLGITLFGIMYMFVHDGLVHRRFPTGPIARLPYAKRLVAAHRLHHSEKYGGVPWGLFLGPQELEAIGAGAELDALVSVLDLGEAAAAAPAAAAVSVGGGAMPQPAKR